MKIAIVGSRNLYVNDFEKYLPEETTEIVSGGAKGIDSSAANYAVLHNIKLTEILPEYNKYGKAAPLKRNLEIIKYADLVIAFWDGKSKGTKYVIDNCKKLNIKLIVHEFNNNK
ncbi:MAG: hypothetical protein ACI4F7_11100 [Acutalibacteraceae bacterium]